jgi:hypothetical protein
VALGNTHDNRLAARHRRRERPGSCLDDPAQELSNRAGLDIAGARDRVRQKGKRASDGQNDQRVELRILALPRHQDRLAYHQRVWSHAPDERYEDLLALAGYIDPALPGWIAATSRVPQTLSAKP